MYFVARKPFPGQEISLTPKKTILNFFFLRVYEKGVQPAGDPVDHDHSDRGHPHLHTWGQGDGPGKGSRKKVFFLVVGPPSRTLGFGLLKNNLFCGFPNEDYNFLSPFSFLFPAP